MKKLYVLGAILGIAACSPKNLSVKWKDTGLLSGQVFTSSGSSSIVSQSLDSSPNKVPSQSSISSNNASFSQKSISVLDSCTNPTVSLFEVGSDGQKTGAAVGTSKVENNGTYKIKLPFRKLPSEKTYVVEVSGCTENLSRVVTEQSQQDISVGTSLLSSWLPNSDVADKIVTADKTVLKSLLNAVRDSDSYTLAYSTILNNSALNADFQRVFGVSPLTLKEVAPERTSWNAPTVFSEGTPSNLSMIVKHWSPEYQFAYKWMVDDVVIGTTANVSFIPNANMQGAHTLKVFYGARDASNELDLTKPYKQKSIAINILNAQPAIVPAVSLTSGALVNSSTLHIALDTGAMRSNCRSFSRIAIKEDVPTSPLLESEFQYTCDIAGTQDLVYNLSGGDGAHTLYVWTQDAAGNISATPRILSVTLDTTNPVIAIGSLAASSRVKGSFTLSGTCEAGTNVSIAGTGVVAQSTTCSSGVFSTLAGLTAGEGSKVLIVSQTDLAGNSSSVSLSVLRDDTAPAPAITFPAASSSYQNSLTLSGSCSQNTGDNQTVTVASPGISGSPLTAVCSSGNFSQSIALIGADGLKTLIISQLDEAGNSGTTSLGVFKDTTAPMINLAGPAVNFRSQSGIVLSGTCEDGTINVGGDTTPTTATCSGGNFSQAITLSGGDGSKTITLTQTDSAGNTGTISRTFLKDTSAPDLNITSPVSNDRFQSTVLVSGTCEPGGDLDFTGSDITPVLHVTCPGSGIFSQSLSLSGVDGTKTFAVDHRDSLNNVTSATVNVVKDNIAPSLALSSPAALTNSQSTLTLTGTCGTATGDQSTITLESTSVDAAPLTLNCSSGNFSQLITLSGSDGTKSVTLKQKDSAQNESSIARSFVKDTTAPILAITSPNSLASFQNTLTLNGTCETGLTVNISGDVSATTATCSGSIFSTSVTLSATDGAKLITISQTDAASNSGSVSRTFYKDTTSPAITFSSPAAGTNFQSMVAISGTCEPGLTISYSGDISSPSSTTCASGSFSDTVTLTAGQGSKTLTLSQTDSAGNIGSQSLAVTRDNTAPLIAFTSPTANSSYQNSVTVSGTCGALLTDLSSLNLSGPFTGSPLALNCISGSFSSPVSLTGADGLKTLSITQQDQAANSSTANLNLYKDNLAPTLTISAPTSGYVTQGSITINGICETGLPIQMSGDLGSAILSCSSGLYTTSGTLSGGDGSKSIALSQTDSAGNSTSVSVALIKDTTAPVSASTSINSGATSTGSRFVQLSFAASDANSIGQICIRLNNTSTPSANDSCWSQINIPNFGVNASSILNVSNYAYTLGITSGTQKICYWYKDSAGNISSNSNTNNLDCASIQLIQSTPPVISSFVVTASESPSSPLALADSTIGSGQPYFVKWKITDDQTLPAGSIKLYRTTDDINYTQLATSLENASNASCQVDNPSSNYDDLMSGCYSTTNSSASFFRLKIEVTDSSGQTATATSSPLNLQVLQVIAGNTDSGLGGSATSAVLNPRIDSTWANPDYSNFVVTPSGYIFFRDQNNGLLIIDPSTGKISKIGNATGTSSGDNGPLSAATFKNIHRIFWGYTHQLVILDDVILRKVDLSTMTISRLMGGGSTQNDGDTALSTLISPFSNISNNVFAESMHILPNGDIYYAHNPAAGNTVANGWKIRYYKHSDQKVYSVSVPSTIGYTGSGSTDFSTCGVGPFSFNYDPVTYKPTEFFAMIAGGFGSVCSTNGAINFNENALVTPHRNLTVRGSQHFSDGTVLVNNSGAGELQRFIPATRTWSKYLGNGSLQGYCPDGTLATQCNFNFRGHFISPDQKVYFVDRNQIRYVDENNLVRTIAGQSLSYGDNELGTSARFNKIVHLKVADSGEIIVLDELEYKFRTISATTGKIDTIAGNGTNSYASLGVNAKNTGLRDGTNSFYGFQIDKTNGDVYYFADSAVTIARLNRSTAQWSRNIGTGATSIASVANGSLGNTYSINPNFRYLVGFDPTQNALLLGNANYVSSPANSTANHFLHSIKIADGTINKLIGMGTTTTNGWSANGTIDSSTKANFSQNNVVYDTCNNRILAPDGPRIRTIETSSQTLGTLTTLPQSTGAFSYDCANNTIYFIAPNGSINQIYKHKVATGVTTALSWPLTTISAAGYSMHFDPTQRTLTFIFRNNSMNGVARYFLPAD